MPLCRPAPPRPASPPYPIIIEHFNADSHVVWVADVFANLIEVAEGIIVVDCVALVVVVGADVIWLRAGVDAVCILEAGVGSIENHAFV